MINTGYPHVAVIKIGFGVYKKQPDHTIFPSAFAIGDAILTFDGDNYEDCLQKVRNWLDLSQATLKSLQEDKKDVETNEVG